MSLTARNAIVQLWPDRPGSTDPAVILAAVQAFPESLAIAASGVIVYANPACCEMFECADPSQLQGRAVDHLMPSLSLVRSAAGDTGLRMEVASARFQLRGREFQVIHARDAGRNQEMKKQVLEGRRTEAVGRLVSGVAHDFNNLLTGILLYCDLLIGELKEDSGPHRHANEMRAAAENGAALVRQLLALARPPAEGPQVFALNDVITGVEDLLARLIGENIILTTSLADDLGAVRMDPAQLQQILLNLVLNARDAMPDGGRIALATCNASDAHPSSQEVPSPVRQWVELAVSDTGCGMDVETLAHAFDPFFTTKKPGSGTGLGLATARRLAGLDGGTMTAESEPGKGTRISLRLPRVPWDEPSNRKQRGES